MRSSRIIPLLIDLAFDAEARLFGKSAGRHVLEVLSTLGQRAVQELQVALITPAKFAKRCGQGGH